MKNSKVLLLNPPGKFNYGRDYFCSKITKSNYVEHPVDLLYLSGILHEKNVQVHLIDAIVDKITVDACKQKIIAFCPDIIIFLSGWVSWVEDFVFLEEIKNRRPATKMIGIGDLFFNKDFFYRFSWIDAVLYDFTGSDIIHYIQNSPGNINNMLLRDGSKIIDSSQNSKPLKKNFLLPLPRHELFISKKYSFPFVKSMPFMSVLTDFGCPFSCQFCVYSEVDYKVFDLSSVFKELKQIKRLGISELFIKDQTFCSNKKRGEALCNFMIENQMNFSWTCFLRVSQATAEFLQLLKNAGCHTIIYGVESFSQNILDQYSKNITIDQIQTAISETRKIGIRSICTFILGFPDENQKSIEGTIDFAINLNPDFAAFNIYVRKTMSVGFSKSMKKNYDQSGIFSENIDGNGILTGKEIFELRKKAIRKFYFRPRYILNEIFSIRSLAELILRAKGFLFLFKSS
ncbi:MAG TPA: radical SAM protein [Nitrospinota bacterium]|nr:radical SAM protein [Nitrospinota bacterium]